MIPWNDLLRRTAATAALCGALGVALFLALDALVGATHRDLQLHLWLAAAIASPFGFAFTALAARALRAGALPIGRTLLRRSERPREFLFWTLWFGLCGALSLALGLWAVAGLAGWAVP